MEFKQRFRGFFPVVVDVETGGFDATVNPLLEIGCQFLRWQDEELVPGGSSLWRIEPFADSIVDPASTKVTGIDVHDPNRQAHNEREALREFFAEVRQGMKAAGCHRAIMVAHNAAFDLGFLNAACNRQGIKRNPFHPFSSIDTASIAAVFYGHTVLAQACERAGIPFDMGQAHTALYDAQSTAKLFCQMVNLWPLAEEFVAPGAEGQEN